MKSTTFEEACSAMNARQFAYEVKRNSCNAFGIDTEIAMRRPGTSLEGLSDASRADCYIMYRAEGWSKPMPVRAEVKTNGGRINHLFGNTKDKFVIYAMDVCNKNTQYFRRQVPAKIIPLGLFLTVIEQLKAWKTVSHEGKVNGIALQHTLKPFYLWLADYPIEYSNTTNYTWEDFQDLQDAEGNTWEG